MLVETGPFALYRLAGQEMPEVVSRTDPSILPLLTWKELGLEALESCQSSDATSGQSFAD